MNGEVSHWDLDAEIIVNSCHFDMMELWLSYVIPVCYCGRPSLPEIDPSCPEYLLYGIWCCCDDPRCMPLEVSK